MIEPTGYTALDLVGFTDRGTYAANVNYVKNDLVHYGGNIWRILIDDTIGITPAEGTNYTLFIGEPTNLVERIIAPLEDNPATVAYTTGRQIIYNDYLYEVIQDIAIGDVLIAYEDDPTNANIKRSSPVETQVLALDGRLDTAEADIVALETGKADNSVIAPVESGTTASRAYAAGAHFIKDGAFCTAKTAIAQGEAFTLNTNYTVGDIGGNIKELSTVYNGSITKVGNYYSNAYLEKEGRLCLLTIEFSTSTAYTVLPQGQYTTIGMLPDGFKVRHNIIVRDVLMNASTENIGAQVGIQLLTTGEIQAYNYLNSRPAISFIIPYFS